MGAVFLTGIFIYCYASDMEQPSAPERSDTKTRIKMIIAAILFFGLLVLYYLWVTQWSAEAKRVRAYQEKYEKAANFIQVMEDALRNDTYGGKTPEETLALFISALENGDIDLASKYFVLETNTSSPNYLTRDEWTKNLKDTVEMRGAESIIEVLGRAKPSSEKFVHEGDFKFYVENSAYINMERNQFSGVWKIESL